MVKYARTMSVVIPARHPVTTDEFMRMAESGAFDPDERVELIEGEIVYMSPIGPPHAACVNRLTMLLAPRLVGRAIVQIQGPFRASDYSMPQPDVALFRLRDHYYAREHARPDDLCLAIEVADSTLRFDRTRKLPLYAAVGVRESWLVDLKANVIEVCTDPTPSGYDKVVRVGPGGSVTPTAFPDLTLAVTQILG
jgi:Uma2 family endonuclease